MRERGGNAQSEVLLGLLGEALNGDLERTNGNEGLGASVCLLLPMVVGGARLAPTTAALVGIPSTRFNLVHSSSCVRGVNVVVEGGEEVEHEEEDVADKGLDVRGVSKAFAALGGSTDSFAFSSRGASMGARGR